MVLEFTRTLSFINGVNQLRDEGKRDIYEGKRENI